MAIQPTCDVCSNELMDFGAILPSPPDDMGRVEKFHICKQCYLMFQRSIKKSSD